MKPEDRRVPVEPLRVSRNGKRFFSEAHKRAVVEKCLVAGASVSAVALAHGFNTNLVRKWIVKHQAARALARTAGALVPVSVIEAPAISTRTLQAWRRQARAGTGERLDRDRDRRGARHRARQGRGGATSSRPGCSGRLAMITLPGGTRIWLAAGMTDMRKGFDGLAALVQGTLAENPFSGHVFVFRGRAGDRVKVLWWDGTGLCLFAKRLERGRFVWPQATSGVVHLSVAQLSMLLEGIDWRRPVRTQAPSLAY